ncbi:MAG TPA: hypothetical protein VMF58_10585 [Rhizomicrobium sp.]|nr:hypothetical protein [Rhizomicrobium sp.]
MKRRGLIAAGGALLVATAAAANPFPWKAGDKPPAIAGVKLGDTEQHALDVLGAPDDVNASPMGELLEYPAKGLELTATKAGGVVAIRLFKAEAGAIGELKVGDTARDVILKWGAPESGQGRLAQFSTNDWLVLVRLADKESTVVEMTLADKHARPLQPDPGPLNTFKTQ